LHCRTWPSSVRLVPAATIAAASGSVKRIGLMPAISYIDAMILPQGLDPDLLRSFVLIAEGRSFTDAAALVGRTQSAISMQVKRLEDLLGQPLLHRGKGGGAELTPHGRYLLEQARQILALNDSVMATF